MGRTSDANERLMDAALDLIWEESYGAVTIDDICLLNGSVREDCDSGPIDFGQSELDGLVVHTPTRQG